MLVGQGERVEGIDPAARKHSNFNWLESNPAMGSPQGHKNKLTIYFASSSSVVAAWSDAPPGTSDILSGDGNNSTVSKI